MLRWPCLGRGSVRVRHCSPPSGRREIRFVRKLTHGRGEGDPRAQARHDPGLGLRKPGGSGDGDPGRALSRRPAQDAGARRLLRRADRVRRGQGAAAEQARARPPQEERCRSQQAPRRDPRRRPLALRGGPGHQRRRVRRGRAGRRDGRLQGQGLLRGHDPATTSRARAPATATTRSTVRPARSAPAPRRPGCSRA
jgi:hypothetical protein